MRDLYARARVAVREEPQLLVRLVASFVMHGLGHPAVAASAGACVRALAGGAAPVSMRSTWLVSAFLSTNDARVIAGVGLAAVVVKVGAGIVATQTEVALAKAVG